MHESLTFNNKNYPDLLKQIYNPPKRLYIRGNQTVLKQPQIAIVGTRRPTPVAKEIAFEFAKTLSQRGWVITSGLAIGIDGAAHRGALAARGVSIAVLPTGIDQVYPAQHVALAKQIVDSGGALVTEFPLGTSVRRWHFCQRNRLITGLSYGVLVAEATLGSGSLISARWAVEQNREVFAFPGSIRNPMAAGCHSLIKAGAKLVEHVDDLIEELRHVPNRPNSIVQSGPEKPLPKTTLDRSANKLLECLGFETTSIDRLLKRTQWSMSSLCNALMVLEFAGYVQRVPGGYIKCR